MRVDEETPLTLTNPNGAQPTWLPGWPWATRPQNITASNKWGQALGNAELLRPTWMLSDITGLAEGEGKAQQVHRSSCRRPGKALTEGLWSCPPGTGTCTGRPSQTHLDGNPHRVGFPTFPFWKTGLRGTELSWHRASARRLIAPSSRER